jgi:hypothetical protein
VSSPLSTVQVKALRRVGDPQLEEHLGGRALDADWVKAVRDLVGTQGPNRLRLKGWKENPPKEEPERTLSEDWLYLSGLRQPKIDDHLSAEIKVAQALFATYGREIAAALLLAALPQTFACQFGAPVLTATGQLTQNLQARIRGTAQFLLRVMLADQDDDTYDKEQPEQQWAEDGAAFKAALALRLFHASTRLQVPELAKQNNVNIGSENEGDNRPLNQEDLLGALLTFTVTVFEVLEMLDVAWTADQQQAYMATWGVVGHHLGIGNAEVIKAVNGHLKEADKLPYKESLVPKTVADARATLALLRDRQWLRFDDESQRDQWRDLTPGRLLTRALLESLVAAMPPTMKRWPETVMRHLNPPIVRDRLALGGGGLLELVAGKLPRRRIDLGRFTRESSPNALTGRVVRIMANEVGRRALLRFLQDGQRFTFPGLEEWSDGLVFN